MRYATTILFMTLAIVCWFAVAWCFTNDNGYYGGACLATSVVMVVCMIIRAFGAFERRGLEDHWY